MPTFTHPPCAVIPKFKGENGTPKLSFFPAELWEDEHGGRPGMWRVAQGDAYVTRPGETVSFYTLEGVTYLAMQHLSNGLGVAVDAPGVLPDIPARTPVLFTPHGKPFDEPIPTYTKTTPFPDACGEWRVWVFYVNNPVLLADLDYREDTRIQVESANE